MRHHHAGHADALENVGHFQLHAIAQLLVQRAHRLIQQQQLRPLGQAARQRHPLPLAAGKLVRLAPGVLLHVHQRQHFRHPFGDFRPRHFVLLQAEGDVLLYRHMREQRVRLKHHVDRPLVRRHVRHILPIEHDLPFRGLFEAGQHAQQGGFAAAGRAEQRKRFRPL